ncbi:MAG TPA: EAL domain-containing protein [Burkholderiales bacterium]|nr:EAL domain-containing protein [Burkholderiales bacterium]
MNAPTYGYTLGFIQSMLAEKSGRASGWFKELELGTAFQPIFSLPHKRAIGFDASVRGTDSQGKPVSAESLFGPVVNYSETSLLDLLSITTHVHNFFTRKPPQGLLFVNLHPEVFLDSEHTTDFIAELVRHYEVPRGSLAIDIPGSVLQDERLSAPLDRYRKLGCLISVDDFGVDNSNLDTVWHTAPAVVKMGRSVIVDATGDQRARQALPRAVSLLHEMGTLVVMEGIETEMEALMAIDSDADFATGFYFGSPHNDVGGYSTPDSLLDALWNTYKKRAPSRTKETAARASLQDEPLHSSEIRKLPRASPAEISRYRDERRPFISAIQRIAALVKSGDDFEVACSAFLALPGAIRCYMLDADGKQVGTDVYSRHPPAAQGVDFNALITHADADWSRRDFFSRARNEPEVAQVTRQYCSLSGHTRCVTFSVATTVQRKPVVVCGDVDWTAHAHVRH